ncbi:SIMPL domain-containing protein [Xanthobacter dioxanivorans]|uniref:SIMPL domain-containing protein n=1 Tax=Xanthobacter dioxanivorans TaxID=2528964 RepID=A0A974SIK4_9HYPH|nr:SIMPL domain-containing protein [Xanthobacter dioxanivorans]QRG06279.1 SIMPL domain-containing protein [Xanthobacter dioxanivorans]
MRQTSFRRSYPLGRLLAGALAAAIVFAVPAGAATLTVVGEARVTAAPDMAVLSTGTVTTAKTADDALGANSKAVAAVIETLKAAGIAASDIATANFSVQPQYSYPQQGSREAPKLMGFEVRNSVRVTVRSLDSLGALLDRVVQSGANQASGLTFALSDPAKLQREAQIASVKEGMDQAKALAAAAGLRLTRITSIQPEGQSMPILPQPMMMKADMARAPVPVEAGEIEVRARTVIVYEVEPL